MTAELERYKERPLRIGSFSAASNVTGIVSDTYGIARLLHEHGALSFWDLAAAAPYVAIEMDPPDDPLAYKDAIFISPHKFIGGPGTPGLLVARRELFTNRVPTGPGGGTVAYVNPAEHVYLDDIEHREEGGTPAIVESIRAGLVFALKSAVGEEAIRSREHSFIDRAIARWGAHPDIEILGNRSAERLPRPCQHRRRRGTGRRRGRSGPRGDGLPAARHEAAVGRRGRGRVAAPAARDAASVWAVPTRSSVGTSTTSWPSCPPTSATPPPRRSASS